MAEIVVRSQKEFDEISQDYNGRIYVEFGTPYNRAAINRTFKGACIVLRENSRAVLYGNSQAILWENSQAVLYGKSHAELWDNSQAVLYGNSQAVLYGNSHAELWENSQAELWEDSHAELWGNSQAVDVENMGNAITNGNSRVVYLPRNIDEYINCYALKNTDKYVTLYKAVHQRNGKYYSDYDADFCYEIGKVAESPEFSKSVLQQCGQGIHLAHLAYALYFGKDWSNCAILECRAIKEDVVVPIPNKGKVRVPRCEVIREVPLEECGLYG